MISVKEGGKRRLGLYIEHIPISAFLFSLSSAEPIYFLSRAQTFRHKGVNRFNSLIFGIQFIE